jgi:oligopeptide transport system substrate-binding protein
MTKSYGWFLLLGLLLCGCLSRSQPFTPGVLRFNLLTEPPTLDWSLAADSASIWVLNNLMEGLTSYDRELNPIPALAERWEILEGGLRYRFHLRPGILWSDGVPLRARDFVYSWRRLVDPRTAAQYAYFLYDVKNARAINSGEIRDLEQLGVRALDDLTLEVELEKAIVFFPSITTFIVTFPLRQEIIERWPESWSEPEHIVTLGPYRLQEWHHEYKLVLERNSTYYGPRPSLDRIVFYMITEASSALTLYETNSLDFLPQGSVPSAAIPFLRGSPEFKSFPYLGSYYYGFNVKKPPVDNALVRRALCLAVDRSKIPKILKGGQIPCSSWIPQGMFGHNPGIGFRFDPERARQFLAEAGYPGGRGFPRLTIAFNTDESHKLVAQFIQQQWREHLGIPVELNNMEWKVYLKELEQDPPQVFRMGWIADYPDPDNFMAIFTSSSGNNHTGWKSREYDELIARAAVEPDREKRQALYDQAQRRLGETEIAILPLYTYAQNTLHKPWVQNYPFNAMDLVYLRDVRVEAP